MLFIFFFFKQKTAYEMRISDWSSDVCSSDLYVPGADPHDDGAEAADPDHRAGAHLSFRFGRHPHADVPSGRRAGDRQGDHAGHLKWTLETFLKAFFEDRKSTRLNSSH